MGPKTPGDISSHVNTVKAAEFLELSPRTLEKWRVIGGGPRFRKHGRRVVYRLEELKTWSGSRECETTSDPNYQPSV
jgi:hypothetical protein